MITVGPYSIDPSDPLVLASAAGMAVALLALVLLIVTLRRTGRSADSALLLAQHLGHLGQRVQALSDGQQQLFGGLAGVSEAQAQQQRQVMALMEARLAEVSRGMTDSLQATSTRTARSLGDLQQRLETIDKAQANIEKLSGNVLSLQDILSNKQARGAFGEIQLQDLVAKALPPDAYAFQATLQNGRRADCLIHLPDPPGPIVIDAKFPLEAYEALRRADTPAATAQATREFRTAVRGHIKAIAERYIVDGETADGALMFLPSEAVYAELHANHGDLVREGFALRVWTVSPTTCMATLNTLRAILKDARMRAQAGTIRTALRQLHRDVEIVVERVDKLNTHFRQAREDLDGISTAAERAGKRAARLDGFDFEGPEAPVLPVVPPKAAE